MATATAPNRRLVRTGRTWLADHRRMDIFPTLFSRYRHPHLSMAQAYRMASRACLALGVPVPSLSTVRRASAVKRNSATSRTAASPSVA